MHLKKKRLFAIVKTANGRVMTVPVVRKQETHKKYDKMWKDVESGLWLYKKKTEYLDRKSLEESAG
jgi:hypothetical protein